MFITHVIPSFGGFRLPSGKRGGWAVSRRSLGTLCHDGNTCPPEKTVISVDGSTDLFKESVIKCIVYLYTYTEHIRKSTLLPTNNRALLLHLLKTSAECPWVQHNFGRWTALWQSWWHILKALSQNVGYLLPIYGHVFWNLKQPSFIYIGRISLIIILNLVIFKPHDDIFRF